MARPKSALEARFLGHVLRDRWKIESKIARGGMGTVFAARHVNNGNTAAIKILHPEFTHDEDTRSRFMQEGYAANQVNHPAVVRILDDDVTEDGFAYLVMELLDGELLERRRLRLGGKLDLAEVYDIVDELLDVLAAAHAKGIVHRDVKPDNLFVTRAGRLKVLDFGFAQMKSSYRPENTATGFLIGTPGFMAPEQAMGQRGLVDGQTDIWAVGATMFLLLSGKPCHEGKSPAELLAHAANFAVRSISTLEPDLPVRLARVIDRALSFAKSDRWPSAESMQQALRAISGRAAKSSGGRKSFPDAAIPVLKVEEDESAEPTRVADRFRRGPSGEPDHPAHDEKPTMLAHPEPRTIASRAPVVPVLSDDADESGSAGAIQGTVVMESRPRPSVPDVGAYVRGRDRESGRQPYPSQPGFGPPSPSSPFSVTPATAFPVKAAGGFRVVPFLLVTGITMVVVILTGLLVILGSE